ncbi:MAG: hypothetical protein V2I33_02665, partial [Kangiellaceae bacterium]|nr:hypothetical protein [Kangiellaceae bacterium]
MRFILSLVVLMTTLFLAVPSQADCNPLLGPCLDPGGGVSNPPNAPVISAPSTSTSGSYTITWQNMGGFSSPLGLFTVYESVNGGSYSSIDSRADTVTITFNLSLSGKADGIYRYYVEASDLGLSAQSNIVTVEVRRKPSVP